MRNIRIVFQYDGTNYHGFQRQVDGLLTIQGILEAKLKILTGEEVSIIGSGRTDAGVHALNQVANFRTNSRIPAERFAPALNSILPYDILINLSEEVPMTFHARFDALAKTYRYSILNKDVHSVFLRNYAYHIPYELNVDEMNRAAQYLIGSHDFLSFASSKGERGNPIRQVMNLICQRGEDDLITVTIRANGFLYNMVRNIVGTLIEVGKGRLSPEEVQEILQGRDRTLAGPTAPAHGLALVDVEYCNGS